MFALVSRYRVRDVNAKGFSLVELLVVVAILAILAAIAIPLFLNQKKQAQIGLAISDVRNLIPQIEGDKSRPAPPTRWKTAANTPNTGVPFPAGVLTDLTGVTTKSFPQEALYIALDCSYSGSGNAVDSPGNYMVWAEAINNISPDVLYDSSTGKWYKSAPNAGAALWSPFANCPNGVTAV